MTVKRANLNFCGLIFSACILFSCFTSCKETHNILSDEEKADGWKLLFDGETMNGWKDYNGTELMQPWHVVDG